MPEGTRITHWVAWFFGAIVIVMLSFVIPSAIRAETAVERLDEALSERTEAMRYTLAVGDRLVHLAKRFDVSVDAILEANDLDDARGLREGQEITIPPPGTKATVKRGGPQLPLDYRVRSGDVLGTVARRFGVSVDDILIANELHSPRSIQAGQTITIPRPGDAEKIRAQRAREEARSQRGAAKTPARGSKSEPAWMRRARKLADNLGLGSRQVAHKLLRGNLEPRWVRAAGRRRAPATLRFPVVGSWVGRGWGSGPGGYHLAVDMPGRVGMRVNAAAPGIVAYANDELAGFGKLVLIIHPGGLVTGYAHNSEFKTVPGERVKMGTRVALLGSSGISQGPHVHFELIYNGELCDPLPLFRPVATHKGGRPALRRSELAIWPRRGGPPKGVRCAARRRHPEYVGKPYGWRPADWGTRHRRSVAAGREAAEEDAPHPDPELTE
jgi:murein DD-endopeptidase MepM/ murein hydrolase activator NlpD